MDQYREIFKNNATVITLIIIVVMFGFFLLSAYGIPYFTNSPDTYDVQEVANFTQTEDKLVVTVENPAAREQLEVVADNTNIPWNENGSAVVDRDEYSNVKVNSYSQNELYQEYDYNFNSISYQIKGLSDNAVLTNQDYTLRAVTNNGPVEDSTWKVDGEVVQESHSVISYRFSDSNKTYTVSSSTTINGSEYQDSIEVNPVDPDDVVINTTATKTDVKVYQEIKFSTFEKTNQSVQYVKYDYGNGDTEVSNITSGTLHWYTEPGEYQVNVTGESNITGNEGRDTVNITVQERDEELDKRLLTVNVYDSTVVNTTRENPAVPDANVSVNNGLVKKVTNGTGTTQFNLPNQQNYTINVSTEGNDFANESKQIYLGEDNDIVDFRLSEPTINETVDDINNTRELVDDEIGLGLNESDINETNVTEPDDSGLNSIIENLRGEGTSNNPYVINRIVELQAIEKKPSAVYSIESNIDAAQTRGWNSVREVRGEELGTADSKNYQLDKVDQLSRIAEESVDLYLNDEIIEESDYEVDYNTGEVTFLSGAPSDAPAVSDNAIIEADYNPQSYYEGFEPIDAGGANTEIRGNGNIIGSMYINRPQEDNVGIINNVSNGDISNLKIEDTEITGSNNVGSLLGKAQNTQVREIELNSVEITGKENVGGIVGQGESVNIEKSRLGTRNNNEINGINGNRSVGGIIGYASSNSQISKASTDSRTLIFANSKVGGIVGQYTDSEILDVSSRARLRGIKEDAGGIAGRISGSTIETSYTISDIKTTTDNADRVGALVGFSDGSYNSVYWNNEINTNMSRPLGNKFGQISGINSLTTDQMKISSSDSFQNFDFDNIWSDFDGQYPKLIQTELNQERYNVTIRSIDVSNSEPISSIVTLGNQGTKSGESTTFTGIEPGEYELTVNSAGYAPENRELEVQDNIEREVQLRNSEDIDAEIIVVNQSGSLIESPGSSFVSEIGTESNSSNPALYESIGEDTYSVSVNNLDGYVDETRDNEPVSKFSPHVIEMGIQNDESSAYEFNYVESESNISDLSSVLKDELESEVIDGNIQSPNPTMRLKSGQRYSINLSSARNPEDFKIVDSDGNTLLTASTVQDETGTYLDNSDVNVNKTQNKLKFNVTDDLLSNMDRYTNNAYDSMGSDIVEVSESDKVSVSLHKFTVNKSVDINVLTNPTIENAEVYLRQGGNRVATSSNGEFTNIKKGEYAITVEANGYQTNSINREIIDGETYNIDMQPSTTDLVNITVNIDDTSTVVGKSIDNDKITVETSSGTILNKDVQSGKYEYEFNSVPSGQVNITYDSEEYLRNNYSVDTSGMDDLSRQFTLEPMATFDIELTDNNGNTIRPNYIRVVNVTKPQQVQPVNPDIPINGSGDSVISIGKEYQLPEGKYDVRADNIQYDQKVKTRTDATVDTVPIDMGTEKQEIVVKLRDDTDAGPGNRIKIDDVIVPTNSPLDKSQVYKTEGTMTPEGELGQDKIILYDLFRYRFELVTAPNYTSEYGTTANIVNSTGNNLISSDFSRPAAISKNSDSWVAGDTGEDGIWSREQVETGIEVENNRDIEFTVTSLYDDVGRFNIGVSQFILEYKEDIPESD